MSSFEGKCVLVTGGSKGIGKATVELLAELKAKVYTCSRNQSELDEALTSWQQKGWNVQGSVCDVKDKAALKELVEKVTVCFDGKLHVLVNNAATNIRKPAVEYTEDDYNTVVGTNLKSVFHLCQLCHPLLKSSGSGCIVHVGSISGGDRTNSSGCLYAMCKAALHQFAKTLACEWARDNIRVNCVAPGYTQTPLAQQVLKNEKFYEEVISETPMKRIAQPPEIASVIKFFCCDDSSFVTGQTLFADGGYSVRGMGY